jgi:TonB-linked SusC/RagA family outer membrane protein
MKTNILSVAGFLMLLSLSGTAAAQSSVDPTTSAKEKTATHKTVEVVGSVVDAATGQKLAGVQIEAMGQPQYSAMTDSAGNFRLKIPAFCTSVYVHSPMYTALQVAVAGGSEVKIKMLSDKFAGMYDDKTNITASKTATVDDNTALSVEPLIENSLGADVRSTMRSGTPGDGASMFIRGLSSLNANAQPLIVIDGVPQDMQYMRGNLHTGEYNNMLLNVNTADIEHVTVLKNATALYGARGAAGVILIETKRGHSMATRIEANVSAGLTLVPTLPTMMNATQYRRYATEMLGSYPDYNPSKTKLHFLDNTSDSYYYPTYHNDTDWSKEVYRQAVTQNYGINVQGGDDVGMYNLSVGYTDAQSTARENGLSRLNVRFNSDLKILKTLTAQFDMDYVKVSRNVFDDGVPADFSNSTITSPTFLGLIKSPLLSPYDYDHSSNSFSSALAGADEMLSALSDNLSLANPTALLANGKGNNKNRLENTAFHARVMPELKLGDFTVSEMANYSLNRNSQRYYRPVGGVPTFYVDGLGEVQSMSASRFAKEQALISDTRLRWKHQFAAHALDIMAGFRYSSYKYDDNQPQGQYQSAGNDKTPNISTSMEFQEADGTDDSWKNMSWYAQANYNYANRYFVEAAASMETDSRFGKHMDGIGIGGVRWGLFPSIQAGWVVSNEHWFPRNIGFNYLKLNVGYDISGNSDIATDASKSYFAVMKYLHRSVPAMQLANIGNDDISYEKTQRVNVGLQGRMLDNRLTFDVDFYVNNTSDLLTMRAFDTPIAGITHYWSNGGELENKGVEFTLTGKPIVRRNLTLELGASVGHYANKVKSLPDASSLYVDGQASAQGTLSSIYGTDNVATIVGQPAGVFYGYKTLGVLKTDEEAKAAGNGGYLYQLSSTGAREDFTAGDMHFADLNGDGRIDESDKTVIGDPNPDLYGNISACLTAGRFTVDCIFNYVLGNDVFNYERSILEGGSNFYNQTTAMTNRWRYEGQQTDMPRIAYGDPMGNSRFSDRWIEDGSYLRMKTLRLTYTVPVRYSWLQGLKVWAQAENIFTLTKYTGSDPEFSVSNAALYQGIDAGNVALSRAFMLGLRINL